MPHSSGGGSHGGGFHGGSHSSHGGSSRRVSHTYFNGARRYVRYRNGSPEYVYSNSNLLGKRSPKRFLIMLFYIPFLFGLFMMAKDSFAPTKPIVDNCSTPIAINDTIGVIDNREELYETLVNFQERTGIKVIVYTVHDSNWRNSYVNLEQFAYDLYVGTLGSDEKHWLIIYSIPDEDYQFVDWKYEAMQGYDTDQILKTSVTTAFRKYMQKNINDKGTNFGETLQGAFQNIDVKLMKVDYRLIFLICAILSFLCFHCYGMVFYDPNKKYRDMVECPKQFKEDHCDFCGTTYVVGTTTTCPHCGAPLTPHEYYNSQSNQF